MMRAFAAEWVKLLRVRQMLAVWGLMAAFAILIVVLFMANAGTEADRAAAAARVAAGERGNGPVVLISELEKPSGLSFGLTIAGDICVIVTLVLFAGNMASEYSHGTLKVLLSRQPRRLQLLIGKLAALLGFAVVGLLATALLQALAGLAVGVARGFDLSQWATGQALGDYLALVARYVIAFALWGVGGAMLAVLLRSGPAAIGIGIAYLMVVEGLLGLVLPDLVKYLPGQAMSSFVAWGMAPFGGSASTTLDVGPAALLSVLYLLLFAGITGFVFRQRDVAN